MPHSAGHFSTALLTYVQNVNHDNHSDAFIITGYYIYQMQGKEIFRF